MKSRRISNAILVCAISLIGYGQITDYNSFILFVKQQNVLAKKANNNNAYGKYQLKASRGNFDPILNSSVENKYFAGKDYITVGNAELKQQIYTSQYIKFGYQYGQGMFVNPENYTPVAGIPYVGLQASVLQGLLFDKNRAEVIKSKHYADYFSAEEKIQLNDLLFTSANTYFDYLYAKKINDLYTYFNNLAQQRLQGINDLVYAGERPAVDTIEASIFLQSRILDRKSGELELNKRYTELMVFKQTDQSAIRDVVVTDSMDAVYFSAKKSLITMLNKNSTNPIIAQYAAKQKVLETEARLKREMIKPILDLNYNFLNNSSSNQSPALGINNYKWGATFSLPLYLRKPRFEYKMANLIAENNQLELINKQNQIDYKRDYILQAIQILTQQITNAEKSAAYSKLLLEAERLKFKNGESSLFLLNSREQKWLESELKLAEYKLKFLKTFTELVYINGTIEYELNL